VLSQRAGARLDGVTTGKTMLPVGFVVAIDGIGTDV
jgi:hypothetical protein